MLVGLESARASEDTARARQHNFKLFAPDDLIAGPYAVHPGYQIRPAEVCLLTELSGHGNRAEKISRDRHHPAPYCAGPCSMAGPRERVHSVGLRRICLRLSL